MRLLGGLKSFWAWVCASKLHLVATLCAALALGCLYEAHRANKAEAALGVRDTAEKASLAAWKAMYRDLAQKFIIQTEQSNANHTIELAGADNATDRYIAFHRVRDQTCLSSKADSTAPADHIQMATDLPAGDVFLSEGDLRACTAATAYAISSHNDAMRAIADGTAIPER